MSAGDLSVGQAGGVGRPAPIACRRGRETRAERVLPISDRVNEGALRPPRPNQLPHRWRVGLVALVELPEEMREVVVLKHCQGWTLPQIAERMGRSVPSVASLLRRGLEHLRKQLKIEPP
jgi:RNA polymerase sigma factor (sigma-70 family)